MPAHAGGPRQRAAVVTGYTARLTDLSNEIDLTSNKHSHAYNSTHCCIHSCKQSHNYHEASQCVCVCVNYQHLTQHKNFYFFLLLHNQFSQFYGVRMDNNYTVSKKRANFGKLSIFII